MPGADAPGADDAIRNAAPPPVPQSHALPVPPPARAQQGALLREEVRKAELEAAMLAQPQDERLRRAYFDHLLQFAGSRSGLSWALLPEIGHPLYFRCGSSDVLNLIQVFREGAYDFPVRATPLRILDLGAYCGYAAVYLARRFPQARILCVEPGPDSFRLLSLNTTPWPRIRVINGAAWHSATRLGIAAYDNGDWGLRLGAAGAGRPVQAYGVPDLLRLAGWSQLDMVKCDVEGAEAQVFADPLAPWLRHLDIAVIEIHQAVSPRAESIVSACFDPALFERQTHGEAAVFQRRTPLRALPASPREIRLLHSEPGTQPLGLQDVPPAGYGFFAFDGDSCQLHPNPPGGKPARVIFPCTLSGQKRFTATLHHAGRSAPSIVFTLILQDAQGGEALRASRTLGPQETQTWSVDLPPVQGACRVVLQTETAPGSANNFEAWARWIGPIIG